MHLTLIRNATLKIRYSGRTFLVDPDLAPKHARDSFTDRSPNPMVDLPMPIEQILDGVEPESEEADCVRRPNRGVLPTVVRAHRNQPAPSARVHSLKAFERRPPFAGSSSETLKNLDRPSPSLSVR
jgi:hypothetical protein